jgi:hypothetical protein
LHEIWTSLVSSIPLSFVCFVEVNIHFHGDVFVQLCCCVCEETRMSTFGSIRLCELFSRRNGCSLLWHFFMNVGQEASRKELKDHNSARVGREVMLKWRCDQSAQSKDIMCIVIMKNQVGSMSCRPSDMCTLHS